MALASSSGSEDNSKRKVTAIDSPVRKWVPARAGKTARFDRKPLDPNHESFYQGVLRTAPYLWSITAQVGRREFDLEGGKTRRVLQSTFSLRRGPQKICL